MNGLSAVTAILIATSVCCDAQQPGCGGHLTSTHGTLKSPRYPLAYTNYGRCTWNIRVQTGMVIRLHFTSFHLESCRGCSCDYVDVISSGNNLGRFCGTTSPQDITTSSNTMTVKFRSDYSEVFPGFRATYTSFSKVTTTTIPRTTSTTTSTTTTTTSTTTGTTTTPIIYKCGGDLKSSSDTLASPGYPRDYPHEALCIWNIRVQTGMVIRLHFTSFNVEYGNTWCSHDYVEVTSSGDNLGRFCGTTIPQDITTSTNTMTVKFESDHSTTHTGFHANYTSFYTAMTKTRRTIETTTTTTPLTNSTTFVHPRTTTNITSSAKTVKTTTIDSSNSTRNPKLTRTNVGTIATSVKETGATVSSGGAHTTTRVENLKNVEAVSKVRIVYPAALGAVCVLVVVLSIVIIVLICKRRNDPRRRQENMLSHDDPVYSTPFSRHSGRAIDVHQTSATNTPTDNQKNALSVTHSTPFRQSKEANTDQKGVSKGYDIIRKRSPTEMTEEATVKEHEYSNWSILTDMTDGERFCGNDNANNALDSYADVRTGKYTTYSNDAFIIPDNDNTNEPQRTRYSSKHIDAERKEQRMRENRDENSEGTRSISHAAKSGDEIPSAIDASTKFRSRFQDRFYENVEISDKQATRDANVKNASYNLEQSTAVYEVAELQPEIGLKCDNVCTSDVNNVANTDSPGESTTSSTWKYRPIPRNRKVVKDNMADAADTYNHANKSFGQTLHPDVKYGKIYADNAGAFGLSKSLDKTPDYVERLSADDGIYDHVTSVCNPREPDVTYGKMQADKADVSTDSKYEYSNGGITSSDNQSANLAARRDADADLYNHVTSVDDESERDPTYGKLYAATKAPVK